MTTNVRLGLLLIAAATIILADRLLYLVWRIVRFQRLRPELQVETMPVLRWFQRRRKLQVAPTEIRDFVVNLELATSLEQTLAGALVETAEQFANRGVFGQRLKRHVETRLALSPEDVIRGLIEDFGSSELRDLLTRLERARAGGMSNVEALTLSVETIEDDIRVKVERDIQRAPIILTIPMVVGVFFVALVLTAYPLIVGTVQTLTGVP
ncbi:MAG: hypothetical protein ISS50_07230 [Anaerolineae bacterium]|nr:hypothetical protein [Anaerolineae bacterium]